MARFATATAVAAALALGAPAAFAQQVVGISSGVKNDVRIKKPNTPLPRPVQLKQRIALNDQVQTGAKSQLQVLLLDKSVFSVGANARLVIDRYVYDPGRAARSVGATVAKGAFRFMSGKPDRGGSSSIRTPVATIGIRGTIVEGVVGESAGLIAAGERAVGRGVRSDPATASLIILRGPGAATQGDTIPGTIDVTAGGRTVQVNQPMLAVFVPGPGQAPIGPFRISRQGLMQVQALLFPAVAERLGLRGPADNLGGDPGSVYYPPARQGPQYPPDGFPPGQFPGQLPGSNDGPPSMGYPTPTIPIPQPGPRPPRGNNPPNNQQGNPGNNAPDRTPPPNNPPAPNNPPPPPPSSTAPPLNAAGAPNNPPPPPPPPSPSFTSVAPNNNPPGAGPNNPPGAGPNGPPPKGKIGPTPSPTPTPPPPPPR